MKIGLSPFNRIYIGTTRKPKNGLELWSKKEDVTDDAVNVVCNKLLEDAKTKGSYQINLTGLGKIKVILDIESGASEDER